MFTADHSSLTVEFLTEQIGPYVTHNPHTGAPRLIEGLNNVWDAINELGGVRKVAMMFNVDPLEVEGWIDDHFIPLCIAERIATILRMSWIELFKPTTGYYNEDMDSYWPKSWDPRMVEGKIDVVN